MDKPLHDPDGTALERPSAFMGKWKILVVDDDADVRYLNCRFLSRAGYVTEGAYDGEQAWQVLQFHRFDLVFTDQKMPRLCGLELAARIRAAGMTLPIIINSGCVWLGEASAYPHLDLAAVLHKPCEYTQVVDAVKRILPLPPLGERATRDPQAGVAIPQTLAVPILPAAKTI